LHPEISKDDFKSYTAKYRNSETEKKDLIEFYEKHGGNMKGLLESIIASENGDVKRFIEFYES
jgi:DnaJ family protein C protein 9